MSTAKRFLILLSMLLLLVACRGGRQQAAPPGGTLSLERADVEHGISANDLTALGPGTPVPFDAGDFIRVRNGGQALLEFADQVSLRIFDNTELQVVTAEFGEDVPLEFQIALTDGDVTGDLTAEGGEVVFTTPTGAEITVLGTEFFISYDTTNEEMAAGNFGGTLNVRTPNMASARSIGDGNYVTWTPGSSLSGDKSIPATYQDFQNQADEMGGIPAVLVEDQTCTDDAHFVRETLDPPGGRTQPNQALRMTWEIENSGDCPWSLSGYMVRSSSDESGYDALVVVFLHPVDPGESIEVSDLVTARLTPGSYRIDWQMVNADGESFGDIWTTRFTVVAPTPTPTASPSPTPTAALLPPEGTLVFSYGVEGPALAFAAADGSATRYLELFGQGPDLGPTGRALAYFVVENIDDSTSRGSIYLLDFASGRTFNLTKISESYDDRDPAISPDGRSIAYASHSPNDADGVYEIRLMDISGKPYDQLTELGLLAREPDWLPDGKTVVFTGGQGSTRNLYRVDVDGKPEFLTDYQSGQVSHPQVSPDGFRIAFAYRTNSRAQPNIYVLTLAAEIPFIEPLTEGGGYSAPAWSPDGQYLAFSGPDGIYIMPADGRDEPKLVVELKSPGTVTWGESNLLDINY